ncbi:MAG: Ig-like domain-containing protein, partial [Polyangia bacterium]
MIGPREVGRSGRPAFYRPARSEEERSGEQTLDVDCGAAHHQFTATADHGAADELVIAGGDDQTGINTTTLSNPLVVEARDQHGNPVDGVEVSFAVTSGSGTLAPSAPQITDADGLAQTYLTLES